MAEEVVRVRGVRLRLLRPDRDLPPLRGWYRDAMAWLRRWVERRAERCIYALALYATRISVLREEAYDIFARELFPREELEVFMGLADLLWLGAGLLAARPSPREVPVEWEGRTPIFVGMTYFDPRARGMPRITLFSGTVMWNTLLDTIGLHGVRVDMPAITLRLEEVQRRLSRVKGRLTRSLLLRVARAASHEWSHVIAHCTILYLAHLRGDISPYSRSLHGHALRLSENIAKITEARTSLMVRRGPPAEQFERYTHPEDIVPLFRLLLWEVFEDEVLARVFVTCKTWREVEEVVGGGGLGGGATPATPP